jgi:hypothetical protein
MHHIKRTNPSWIVVGLLAILVAILSLHVAAADVQEMAKQRSDQILDMIGPAGIFAILGSIVMVRAIRAVFACGKKAAFLLTIAISMLIGSGSAWAGGGAETAQAIVAGGFLCVVGTPLSYELLRWLTAFAYQHTKWRVWKAMYFTLSPRSLVPAADTAPEPDGELTQFFDDKTTPQ